MAEVGVVVVLVAPLFILVVLIDDDEDDDDDDVDVSDGSIVELVSLLDDEDEDEDDEVVLTDEDDVDDGQNVSIRSVLVVSTLVLGLVALAIDVKHKSDVPVLALVPMLLLLLFILLFEFKSDVSRVTVAAVGVNDVTAFDMIYLKQTKKIKSKHKHNHICHYFKC